MKEKLNLKCILKMRGFSLIELVLALALSSILILALSSMFYIGEKSLSISYKDRKYNEENSFILDYIKDEISKAKYYYPSNTDGSITIVVDATNNTRRGKYEYIYYENWEGNIYRLTMRSNKLYKMKNTLISSDGKNTLGKNIKLHTSIEKNLLKLEIYKDEKSLMTREVSLRCREIEK